MSDNDDMALLPNEGDKALDAPERIWICKFNGQRVKSVKDCDIEFVRADLASDWQDIETAPRDGSMVLGWYKGWDNPLIIWWYTGAGRWNTAMTPTHWRQLPLPPFASKP